MFDGRQSNWWVTDSSEWKGGLTWRLFIRVQKTVMSPRGTQEFNMSSISSPDFMASHPKWDTWNLDWINWHGFRILSFRNLWVKLKVTVKFFNHCKINIQMQIVTLSHVATIYFILSFFYYPTNWPSINQEDRLPLTGFFSVRDDEICFCFIRKLFPPFYPSSN